MSGSSRDESMLHQDLLLLRGRTRLLFEQVAGQLSVQLAKVCRTLGWLCSCAFADHTVSVGCVLVAMMSNAAFILLEWSETVPIGGT